MAAPAGPQAERSGDFEAIWPFRRLHSSRGQGLEPHPEERPSSHGPTCFFSNVTTAKALHGRPLRPWWTPLSTPFFDCSDCATWPIDPARKLEGRGISGKSRLRGFSDCLPGIWPPWTLAGMATCTGETPGPLSARKCTEPSILLRYFWSLQQPLRKVLRESDAFQVDLSNPHFEGRRIGLQAEIAIL